MSKLESEELSGSDIARMLKIEVEVTEPAPPRMLKIEVEVTEPAPPRMLTINEVVSDHAQPGANKQSI